MEQGKSNELQFSKKSNGFGCSLCKKFGTSLRMLSCLHLLCFKCYNKSQITEAGDSHSMKCPVCLQIVENKEDETAELVYSDKKCQVTGTSVYDNENCNCKNIEPFFQNDQNNKVLKFFCSTCNGFSCIRCLPKEHPEETHKCDFVANAADTAREDMLKLLNGTKSTIEYYRFVMKCLNDSRAKFNCQRNTCVIKIENSHAQFLSSLEERYQKKLVELRVISFEMTEDIEKLQTHVLKNSQLLKGTIEKVAPIYDKLSLKDSISISAFLKSRTKALDIKIEELQKKITFQLKIDTVKIENFIKTCFGQILLRSESIDVKNSAGKVFKDKSNEANENQSKKETNFMICGNTALKADNIRNINRSLQRNRTLGLDSGYYNSIMPMYLNASQKERYLKLCHTFGPSMSTNREQCYLGGFCFGLDEEIIVTNLNNHRIDVFLSTGNFIRGFGSSGKQDGYLWYPRKVALMPNNKCIIVCDRGTERSRLQIFFYSGVFKKKIVARFINYCVNLEVNKFDQIIVLDRDNSTIFVITEDGEIVHWFDCNSLVNEPSDIALFGEHIYLCDFKGHAVVVMNCNGRIIYKLNSQGKFYFPSGIHVMDTGEIILGSSHGHKFHVTVFSSNYEFLGEKECKLNIGTRCSGLKVTNNGRFLTMSKRDSQVLIFS